MRVLLINWLMALVLIVSFTAFAQEIDERGIVIEENKSFMQPLSLITGAKRLALIVGNQDYTYIDPLVNPEKDARDLAAKLEELAGFEVILGLNLGFDEFQRTVEQFKESLAASSPDTVGLVFYAGHGFEYDGVNYLLPTDIDLSVGEKQLISQSSISLNYIIDALEPSSDTLDIVILDACRNDPFQNTKSFRRNGGGWAKVEQAGLYVSYGTAPGETASDGEPGKNGVFTGFILEKMEEPGAELDEFFKKVRKEVIRETRHKPVPQNPVVFSGSYKPFVLHECGPEDNCGSWHMWILYGSLGTVVMSLGFGGLYIRRLAGKQKQSMVDALKEAVPLSKLILPSETGLDNRHPVPPKTEPLRDPEGEVVGYLRHDRHNKIITAIKADKVLTIGREKDSQGLVNVLIADTKGHIGRFHAQIGWDNGRKCFWLMDKGSKNGTYLDKEQKLKPYEIYYINSGQTFYLASSRHPMSILKAE